RADRSLQGQGFENLDDGWDRVAGHPRRPARQYRCIGPPTPPFPARPSQQATEETMTDDLWPIFTIPTEVKAPVHLLKEQAAALPRKTNKIAQGYVSSFPAGPNNFGYVFQLESSLLPGYSYQLLTITYPLDFYPVTLTAFDEPMTAANEADFRAKLAGVF